MSVYIIQERKSVQPRETDSAQAKHETKWALRKVELAVRSRRYSSTLNSFYYVLISNSTSTASLTLLYVNFNLSLHLILP